MKGKLVYLLDDDPDICQLAERILQRAGYRVRLFFTAREFIAQLHLTLPDIIILDIILPDGNGLDICRLLSGQPPTSSIPVLIISGFTEHLNSYKSAGAWSFIDKPFLAEELLSKLKVF